MKNRIRYYATCEGTFWSFPSRDSFCNFLRKYVAGTVDPNDFGHELRHAPIGVMGHTKNGSEHCVAWMSNVVLVRLYQDDLRDTLNRIEKGT